MHPFVDRPTTHHGEPDGARRFLEPTADIASPFPSVFDTLPRLATQPRHPLGWRKAALLAGFLAVPAAGVAVARATTRWRGVLAGGVAALAIGAVRMELARWFTPEPAFDVERRIRDLELRRYPARIEASALVEDAALEAALDRGYSRLASFVYGASDTGEILERTMPVMSAMRDGHYAVSFVMPPGRTLDELPRPRHRGIELREVPARRVAALRFRGRFTRDNIAAHERVLLTQLVDTGLSARGSVTFAAFDAPVTLPALRRNELWIEIV